MNKNLIISTAAALFAAGTIATAAHAQSTNKCYGVNACKGQGMTVTGTAIECTATGGSPTP